MARWNTMAGYIIQIRLHIGDFRLRNYEALACLRNLLSEDAGNGVDAIGEADGGGQQMKHGAGVAHLQVGKVPGGHSEDHWD